MALIAALAAVLAAVLIAGYILRINQRLTLSLAELQRSQAKYRMLTETMKDVVWTLDAETLRFLYVSPSVAKLRGYTAEEVMAQPMDAALTEEGRRAVRAMIDERSAALRRGEISPRDYFTSEVEQPCKDGSTVWTEVVSHYWVDVTTGRIEVHGVTRDIGERRQAEERMRHMAQHDTLTGLANRTLFADRLAQALTAARRDQTRLALLFLDLDRFKAFNDQHGHALGDRLLQGVAQRILGCVRESDTAARIGGDEFVVLLRKVHDADDALAIAEKIRLQACLPLELDGVTADVAASIGVALYPEHGAEPGELLQRADAAMYAAKQEGRNQVRLSAPPQAAPGR